MRIKNLQLRVNGERGIGKREQVGRSVGRAGTTTPQALCASSPD